MYNILFNLKAALTQYSFNKPDTLSSIKNILTNLLFLYLPVGVLAQDETAAEIKEIRGSGHVVQVQKSIDSFTYLHIEYITGNLRVEVGSNVLQLEAQLDDNLLKLLQVENTGDTLKLSFRDPQDKPVWTRDATVKMVVKVPLLQGLIYKANGTITVSGLNGDVFSLTNYANGKVTLQGVTGSLQVVNMANGLVQADKLLTRKANVVSQANGTIYVNTKGLNAIQNGRGSIINVAKKL